MTDIGWWRFNGACLFPARPEAAERMFEINGRYHLETHFERSSARHRAYFASINEAWHNLPLSAQDELPSPEHLRKYALIKTGWRDERRLVVGSEKEAVRVAAFIRPMDSFAIVLPQAHQVLVWTARSQSYRAMNREDFNASMDDVLDYIAGLIGVSRVELEHEGIDATA
jgi:hypothetical protein